METDEIFYGVRIAIEKDLCSGCAECIDSCFEEALKLITTNEKHV